LAFVSGQLPIDPASGQLVAGDAAVQAEVILGNLKAILEAAGSSPAKTVKATLYLKDMNDFAKVNEVYGRFFPSARLRARRSK
jgi:2-iminobutanoate/2-iminopropanoate deaminase